MTTRCIYRGRFVSYLTPDLSWGGHFPDELRWTLLLGFAVRGLVRSTGAGDRTYHIGMDTSRGHWPLLRLLSRGRTKTFRVSECPVHPSVVRVVQRRRSVSPRCHLSPPLGKDRRVSWRTRRECSGSGLRLQARKTLPAFFLSIHPSFFLLPYTSAVFKPPQNSLEFSFILV